MDKQNNNHILNYVVSKRENKKVLVIRQKKTTVKSSCIQDRGKPGKGPKILPPVSDKHFHHLATHLLNRQVKT